MSETILVVDDNPSNRALVRAMLEAAKYSVDEAEDGDGAIERFQSIDPGLILLDIMMPKVDGFEACRRLRALPQGEDVPIVFLTALFDAETHERALHAGADDFLGKPINRIELLIRVRSLLRVRRLQGELRRERDALVKLHEQKELLSALLVHDLKNPLASIIANGQYVLGGDEISGDSRDAIRDVLDSAQTMHQMVMNLLDISRAEDGVLLPGCITVDVEELLQQVRRRNERRLAANELALEIDNACREPLHADPELLTRVIENLLDNCIKYAPRSTTITIAASTDGPSFELAVRDLGQGVPVERRQIVFDKYVQDEREASQRTGRGLGLVFCRLAVEAHGGRIWVEDNEPKGAAFRLTLPREGAVGVARENTKDRR